MQHPPTEEQAAILEAVRTTKDNLIIDALAGAAKTTTLVMIGGAVRPQPTISLAFNKKIADEMAKRLPSFIESKTLNSLGHGVWGRTISKRLVLDTDKTYNALQSLRDKMSSEEKKALAENYATIMRAVGLAKSAGFVPSSMSKFGRTLLDEDSLMDSFALQLDTVPDDWLLHLVTQVLEISIGEAFSGKIDFNDQIYMSTLFGGVYPRYPLALVDEAQDLSPLNHESLKLLYGGRIIAVGDPFQSIYAFRGAHRGSMGLLRDHFKATTLNLSVTFRCPQAIVRRAQARVPHFKWAPGAPEGVVKTLHEWAPSEIPDGATIICRNNAPLFRTAMRLIRAKRSVKLLGAEIGKGLIKIMAKLGDRNMLRAEAILALGAWEKEQKSKTRDTRWGPIEERAQCIEVFLDIGQTLDEAILYAEHLFAMDGKINLTSGHKSKGGEWDIVYHLDPWLVPSKHAIRAQDEGDPGPMDQELNLKYVIETRAKKEMYLINSDDMVIGA